MQLRPYQIDAINAVQKDWQTHTDVLGVMATGGGKTQVFSELLDREINGSSRRGLVLVHRKELVEQARDRLTAFWPHWGKPGRTGIVMAEQDDAGAQIVFATVQTLASAQRLARVLQFGPINVVITDEAHHASAAGYQAVYKTLRETSPALRHLGVTATPVRADGVGLVSVFQKTSFSIDIRDLVRLGYLVPPRWLAIQTGISLQGVSSRRDSDGERDYNAKQLANVYETGNCFELVVETHKKFAADRQAVAFTTTVEGAHDLADTFRQAGIEAQAADATTDRHSRRQILADFRAGRTRVLCNVGLYTEGLDVPEVSCIHQVRPTQSDGLYIQMIGRALRLFADKHDALILDYAPKEARQIVMLGDVLGAPARKDAYLTEDAEEGEVIGGFTFDQMGFRFLEGNPAEIISRQLDYLDASPFHWRHSTDGWLTIGLGRGSDDVDRTLAISPASRDGEPLVLYGIYRRPGDLSHQAAELMRGDFSLLSARAEELSSKHGNPVLARKSQHWHEQPPSAEQEKFAGRIGITKKMRDGLTKGQLAQLITHTLALRAIQSLRTADRAEVLLEAH